MRNREKTLKVCLYGLLYDVHLSNAKRIRLWAVHPLNKKRETKGEYAILVKELEQYPAKYYQYFRISMDRFNYILQKIFKRLQGNVISPKEKLVITLK